MKRKLLLVEDHALVRESLLLMLAQRLPGLHTREAGTLAEAMAALALEPDIDAVVLDLDLPDSRGLDTLLLMRVAAPQVPVYVMSAHDTPDNIVAAIDQGAAGFVSKTSDAQALVAALQHLVAGGVVLPALADLRSTPESAPPELSERQRDMLRMLIEGKSNKLICRELGLSEATVKTHLQAVFRKLEVNTRTQAVLAAARLGLRF